MGGCRAETRAWGGDQVIANIGSGRHDNPVHHARPAHALQAAQPVSQGFGRGFTDVANPQRKQQARQ